MPDVTMKGFLKLTSIDKALEEYFRRVAIKTMPSEVVSLADAVDRVLAQDIICPIDLPPFDRSAVDGYAVRAEDTFGGSQSNPLVLSVVGQATVGAAPKQRVLRGQAIEIATGAPIPEGCDAVLMLEDVERTKEHLLEIHRPVSPGENVSKRGEDVEKGQLVLQKGLALRPQDVAILAAIGMSSIRVNDRPTVGVLSTGDELQKADSELEIGRIFDSNGPGISSMVKMEGCLTVDLGIARDDFSEIRSRIQKGLQETDLVLVTGGTSTGEHDLLPAVVNSLGKPGVIVHGVAMRPGRPAALCAVQDKPVILLPGFPVAAMLAFNVLVKPVLQRLGGVISRMPEPTVTARAARRVASVLGNRTYVRVLVTRSKGQYLFEPLRVSGSGVISSLVKANGIVVIPENKEGIETNEEAEVTLLRPVTEVSF